jgi:hypothetical protein
MSAVSGEPVLGEQPDVSDDIEPFSAANSASSAAISLFKSSISSLENAKP